MREQIKVAFFDIDGTLASNKDMDLEMRERIPESTRQAVKQLKENGILPVIATGRTKPLIGDLMELLNIDSVVCANGLNVICEGNELFRHLMAEKQVEYILKLAQEHEDITIMVETTGGTILHQKGTIKGRLFPGTTSGDWRGHDVFELTVIGENIKERLPMPDGLKMRMVAPGCANIFAEHISKATGIEKVLSSLGLDKSQSIAFGDEENDLEMFGAVGFAVAMGNGADSVKSIAGYVTDTVDNDGIYKACKHLKLI